jgi:phytanoyl-CoA hydroxylase
LSHNEVVFKKMGIKKKYYSPISSKDFAGLPGSTAQNFSIDKQKLVSCKLFAALSDADKESLLSFDDNGFALISNYLSHERVDEINREIISLQEQGKVKFRYRNKIMFAIHHSELLWKTGNDEKLKEVLSVLLGNNAKLFQSINFLMGSEQATHSDSIHMTTYPLGGLLGVWIALEDIAEDNGPLHYYPQSHKLPYYLNSDYDNEGNFFFIGDKSYTDYENMMRKKIKELKLERVKFLAKKGDLFIWHANLFHGGDPHLNKDKTRKSMVFHYFKEDAICYHEITQRPALIKSYR